ncbi:MAG: metallophosphoesterase [Bacteriovoracaceae bacterium]|nr:metallophosphoesterase [Bacteriovoracaceae bacterium]
MYDFIGDIHGYADNLENLLSALGYKEIDGIYQHPERKAFFVGDFIDRGQKIKRTLEIVKSMVDNGKAKAVIGNHEFNYICLNLYKGETPLREHSTKNMDQVKATTSQLKGIETLYLDWFKTLPLWYEEDSFRVVHACWEQEQIDILKKYTNASNALCENSLMEHYQEGSELFEAIEVVLKGPEEPILKPEKDTDGTLRHKHRVTWWKTSYKKDQRPVFFGHYRSNILEQFYNALCIDFGVDNDNGCIGAYSFNGEQALNPEMIKEK